MRYAFIDEFRGFSIFLMLFFNFLSSLAFAIPFFLLHNQGNVLLFGDLIAPFFQFLIGACTCISVSKRRENGASELEILKHIGKRALFLVFLGLALDVFASSKLAFTWGVLESLGVGLFIAYLALFLPLLPRALSALALTAVYAYAMQFQWFASSVSLTQHGGPLGAISFAVISIFGAVFAELLLKEKRENFSMYALCGSLALLGLGSLASSFIPFNKLLVSPSYALFASGASLLFFLLFYFLSEIKGIRLPLLSELGLNALALWILQFLLFFYPLWFLAKNTNFLAFLPEGVFAALALTLVFILLNKLLLRANVRISL
ncbi:MAG: heparan-alpha-glucosaminide N-acetyltransferase domain-containing protein [Candidatus Micrarchaeota archaeon]